jgi:hypothetical protein
MGALFEDTYGHQLPQGSAGVSLALGAVGVVTAGSISGTTNAGANPTVSGVNAKDSGGSFTLNPVTGGGAQAAGTTATVRFVQPYSAIPKAVIVTVNLVGGATTPVLAAAVNITVNGFDLSTTILTTAASYVVQYTVIP